MFYAQPIAVQVTFTRSDRSAGYSGSSTINPYSYSMNDDRSSLSESPVPLYFTATFGSTTVHERLTAAMFPGSGAEFDTGRIQAGPSGSYDYMKTTDNGWEQNGTQSIYYLNGSISQWYLGEVPNVIFGPIRTVRGEARTVTDTPTDQYEGSTFLESSYYESVWIQLNVQLARDGIFTQSNDTVNFNRLTTNQKDAIRNGADKYDGLNGSDNVVLPDTVTMKSIGWSRGTRFVGGEGNDTITGGNDRDAIFGGGGADKLIAVTSLNKASGADTLSGGDGADEYFVEDGDRIIDFKSDDVIHVLSRYRVDGLLVAFDGQELRIEVFDDKLSTKETVRVDEAISTSFLSASVTNLGPGSNSIALFYRPPPVAAPDKLNLFTINPRAARAENSKLGEHIYNLRKEFLKDTSDHLLGNSLDIQLKNGLTALTPAILQAIGRKLNIFLKVKDFNDKVVPVLVKQANGGYKTDGQYLGALGVALYDVFVPYSGTITQLGKLAYGFVIDTIDDALTGFFAGLTAAFRRYGDGNEAATGTKGPDFFYMRGGDDSAYGGGGNDTFKGGSGAGDDLYSGGSGVDTVTYTSAKHAIKVNLAKGSASGKDIDRDRLVSIENVQGGRAGDKLTGNSKANWMDGFKGNDVLMGGAGRDSFVFMTGLSSKNVDRITDFRPADDTILLDHRIFKGLGERGPIQPSALLIGAAAAEADDRLIYDPANGALYYDPDGTGSRRQIKFAVLSKAPAINADDFLLF